MPAVDARIGAVDEVKIVITPHALPHGEPEALPALRIAQQLAYGGCSLLGRGDIGDDAACAERRMLIVAAEQDLATSPHIGCHGGNSRSTGFQDAQRL